ncbi:hypothetical protein K3495_g13960, partial [Podosphaera aphanis]
FLTNYEGSEPIQDLSQQFEHLHVTPEEEDDDLEDYFTTGNFFSEPLNHQSTVLTSEEFAKNHGEINGFIAIGSLIDKSTKHILTHSDSFMEKPYSSLKFEGIIIDTGAAKISTAGFEQFLALKRLQPELELNTSRAGEAKVTFGIGKTSSIGTIDVCTPIGNITFHVTESTTPFLLCLADMDKMHVHYNNLTNLLVQQTTDGERTYPVIRKYGHPFLLLEGIEQTLTHSYERDDGINECHLTDVELRQLHRRFGHPSANRLAKLLDRSGHEFSRQAIEHLTKYCDSCQKHGKSPRRFKFSFKDDREFNSCIYIDVLWIDEKPVLQVVDEATRFQAARWLKAMNAQEAWNALRNCWIDVYLGPPDVIVHDSGTNFTGKEFKQSAVAMSITTRTIPTEVHHGVGRVERYHIPLRQAYEVISKDLAKTKAVNDTAGPDGLVPTLLVFGAYPRMTESDPPAASIFDRAMAIKTAMKEVRKIHAREQVRTALTMRNGPRTSHLKGLSPNSQVLVWRETKEWTGPHTLLRMNGEDCVVQIGNYTPTFRATSVKPYFVEENAQELSIAPPPINTSEQVDVTPEVSHKPTEPRRSSRLNRPKDLGKTFFCFNHNITVTSLHASNFISAREEIDDLITQRVFDVIQEATVSPGERIFNARMVDAVKYNDSTPYEKSRLVIQAFNDFGKSKVLTQSPAIQRTSQRLIMSLAPSLILNKNFKMMLRDITQAYIQSSTNLNRRILARPPREIAHLFPPGAILLMLKPLYGIPESGNHWWNTYHKHHLERLLMRPSTYDPCLLVSTSKEAFGLIGMQVDDTLGLTDTAFLKREAEALTQAKFLAKPLEILSAEKSLTFNGARITLESPNLYFTQKSQARSIMLVDGNSITAKDDYRKQRARGAYVASICQPQACFALSTAAQHQDQTNKEIKQLNICLQRQLQSQDQGIRYIPVKLETAKLFVFVDAS